MSVHICASGARVTQGHSSPLGHALVFGLHVGRFHGERCGSTDGGERHTQETSAQWILYRARS